MSDKHELEEQVTRLTALVEEMQSRIARMEGKGSAPQAKLEAPRSRRDLLKMGGAAALGAVGAAAMRVVPAAAANGDPMVLGTSMTALATTKITGGITSQEVLAAEAKGFPGGTQPPANSFFAPLQGLGETSGDGITVPFADGVDGWAAGDTGIGVYGLSDSGTGVVGESSTGVSVYARGSGRIEQDIRALNVSGVPDYLPGGAMEQVRDSDGTLWLSNAAGKWRRASTFEMFPDSRRVFGNGGFLSVGQIVLNIDATKKLNGTPSGVPAGVVAAWCAVQSYEPCVLDIYPAGSPDPGTGSFGVMGTAGISVQLSWMMVPLNSAGKFSITNRRTKCRVFFDVWGYLSQSASV
jgi:hypothetical protein